MLMIRSLGNVKSFVRLPSVTFIALHILVLEKPCWLIMSALNKVLQGIDSTLKGQSDSRR